MTVEPDTFKDFAFHVKTAADPDIVLREIMGFGFAPDGLAEVGWLVRCPNGWQATIRFLIPQRHLVAAKGLTPGACHRDLIVRAKVADVVSVTRPDGTRMCWGEADELHDQSASSVLSLIRMIAKEGRAA